MIQTRRDRKRGCGWRKAGGLYLVAEGVDRACGVLPIPLERCPVCNHGIKPSRGWTWVDVAPLIPRTDLGEIICRAPNGYCKSCSFPREGKHGLLWIGEQFYATPQQWLRETASQGVSRRITALPNGFKLGETWVLVAHRKAIVDGVFLGPEGPIHHWIPGIFQAFKPSAVEYVVKDDDSEDKLKQLEKRGITPVRIERVEDQPELTKEPA